MRTVRRWRSRSQWKFVPASTSPGRIDLSSFQSLFSNREPIISKPGYGRLRSRSGRKSLDLGIIEFNCKTLDGSESAAANDASLQGREPAGAEALPLGILEPVPTRRGRRRWTPMQGSSEQSTSGKRIRRRPSSSRRGGGRRIP